MTMKFHEAQNMYRVIINVRNEVTINVYPPIDHWSDVHIPDDENYVYEHGTIYLFFREWNDASVNDAIKKALVRYKRECEENRADFDNYVNSISKYIGE